MTAFIRRITIMFMVIQPPVLAALAVRYWLAGSPTQTVSDAFATTFALGYIWGLPVFTLLVVIHSGIAPALERRLSSKPLAASALLGLGLGTLVGLVFTLLGRPDNGATAAFLVWPAVSGGAYGWLTNWLERRQAKAP